MSTITIKCLEDWLKEHRDEVSYVVLEKTYDRIFDIPLEGRYIKFKNGDVEPLYFRQHVEHIYEEVTFRGYTDDAIAFAEDYGQYYDGEEFTFIHGLLRCQSKFLEPWYENENDFYEDGIKITDRYDIIVFRERNKGVSIVFYEDSAEFITEKPEAENA